VKAKENIDVLVLGASDAYRGYDPRFFDEQNIKIFNLGSSVQTPIQTEVLLSRYFKKLNPKLVIYNVQPTSFTNTGVEASGDLIYNDYFESSLWSLAIESKNFKVINTCILRSIQNLFDPNYQTSETQNNDDVYIPGGYVMNTAANQYEFGDKLNSRPLENKQNYQVQAFMRIIDTFKNANIPYILVETPKLGYINGFVDHTEITTNWFSLYGEIINGNKIYPYKDSIDFYDCNHMTHEGVLKFNSAILPHIQDKLRLSNPTN
jgi:hypothetical protein